MDILGRVWIPLKPREGFSGNTLRHTTTTISSPIRWELSLTEVSLYWNNLTSADIKIWTTIFLQSLGGPPRMNNVPSTETTVLFQGRGVLCMPNKCWTQLHLTYNIFETYHWYTSIYLPPGHTIVICADVSHTLNKKCRVEIDNVLLHRMLTSCDDAHTKEGPLKKVDLTLRFYEVAHLQCVIHKMCFNERVPRGSGILCRLVFITMKGNWVLMWNTCWMYRGGTCTKATVNHRPETFHENWRREQ